MRNIDRRNCHNTIGLSIGFALLGGFKSLAANIPQNNALDEVRLASLNANDNPYGPSKRVKDLLSNNFDLGCHYPFKTLSSLVEIIADKEGVSKNNVV